MRSLLEDLAFLLYLFPFLLGSILLMVYLLFLEPGLGLRGAYVMMGKDPLFFLGSFFAVLLALLLEVLNGDAQGRAKRLNSARGKMEKISLSLLVVSFLVAVVLAGSEAPLLMLEGRYSLLLPAALFLASQLFYSSLLSLGLRDQLRLALPYLLLASSPLSFLVLAGLKVPSLIRFYLPLLLLAWGLQLLLKKGS